MFVKRHASEQRSQDVQRIETLSNQWTKASTDLDEQRKVASLLEKDMEAKDFDLSERDKLFEDAARLIVQNQMGSTSLIQRRMKLGYNRAGRLMDQLEAAGIVGENKGSKARDVLVKTEMDLEEILARM